jgi:hypothetical protein
MNVIWVSNPNHRENINCRQKQRQETLHSLFELLGMSTQLTVMGFKAPSKTDDVPVSNSVAVMYAPTLGPEHPMKKPNQASCGISKIQYTEVADWSFDEQFNAFQSTGRAINISDNSRISSLHQEPDRIKAPGTGIARHGRS